MEIRNPEIHQQHSSEDRPGAPGLSDETPIYGNEGKKKGRSPRGKKLYRFRPRHATRYTLHCYSRQNEVVYWELCKKNADDGEILRVIKAVAPLINEGDVLLWDQLGRSGRAKNPTAQHFNPEAISEIEDRGATVIHLPPLGKYLDPLELLFNDLKEHFIRPHFHGDGRNLTMDELNVIIHNYMTNVAPQSLPGFFRKRANGRELFEEGLLD